MSTVAYLAVSPEGRTDRHCVLLGDDSLPGLRRLTQAVHAAGAAARPRSVTPDRWPTPIQPGPARPSTRRLNASGGMTRASPTDIARITGSIAAAPSWRSRPASTVSRSIWPQLPAERFPESRS